MEELEAEIATIKSQILKLHSSNKELEAFCVEADQPDQDFLLAIAENQAAIQRRFGVLKEMQEQLVRRLNITSAGTSANGVCGKEMFDFNISNTSIITSGTSSSIFTAVTAGSAIQAAGVVQETQESGVFL